MQRLRNLVVLGVLLMPVPAIVIACAGQSNMMGRADEAQAYWPANLDATTWNGSSWVDLTDANYGASVGSFVPHLASRIGAYSRRSVGFVPGAVSGSSILQWLPGQTFYNALKAAVKVAGGGLIGYIWHQGEKDSDDAMPQNTYYGHLNTLADGVFNDFSVRLIPCLLQNFGGGANTAAINAAIIQACADNSHLLLGPDFSGLSTVSPNGDGSYHLTSGGMMQLMGRLWSERLIAGRLLSAARQPMIIGGANG